MSAHEPILGLPEGPQSQFVWLVNTTTKKVNARFMARACFMPGVVTGRNKWLKKVIKPIADGMMLHFGSKLSLLDAATGEALNNYAIKCGSTEEALKAFGGEFINPDFEQEQEQERQRLYFTLKSKGLKVTKDLDQSKLWATQTPQSYKRDVLEKALAGAAKRKSQPDDEAGAVFALKKDVHLVPSDSSNIKVQTMDDILLAAALLRVH